MEVGRTQSPISTPGTAKFVARANCGRAEGIARRFGGDRKRKKMPARKRGAKPGGVGGFVGSYEAFGL